MTRILHRQELMELDRLCKSIDYPNREIILNLLSTIDEITKKHLNDYLNAIAELNSLRLKDMKK